MKFELGKTYRHTSGKIMTIVGELSEELYGINCFVGERGTGDLIPVSKAEDNTNGWEEIDTSDDKE